MLNLANEAVTYTIGQAEQVIGGYAFATKALTFNAPHAGWFGVPPAGQRAVWSYASYDCVPPSLGPLDGVDLMISIALSSQISADAILGMQVVAPVVSEALANIPITITFWDLPPAEISNPAAGSYGWWMERARQLLVAVPDVAAAIAHKTLHHKRPWQFPLLDNKTLAALPSGQAWVTVHNDLTTQIDAFADLEAWFAAEAAKRSTVSLTRLRLHDILLWCDVTGQRGAAGAAGQALGF